MAKIYCESLHLKFLNQNLSQEREDAKSKLKENEKGVNTILQMKNMKI